MPRADTDTRTTLAPPRRGLRRPEAALYVGVSESKFSDLVRDGLMPQPIKVAGCTIWDVRALDFAFDRLSAQHGEEANEWD